MSEAKRNKCGVRFDIIPAECLIEVAKVLSISAERYGTNNWQKSRMTGENGPMNHALKHLINYQAGIPDEDGPELEIHLTHAIVNLMFEFWYVKNLDNKPVANVSEVYKKSCVMHNVYRGGCGSCLVVNNDVNNEGM